MGRRPDDGYQYGKKPIFDRIMEKYTKLPGADVEDLNLTDEEQGILNRWIFIDGLVRKHRPNMKMADIETITRKRFQISHGQFWMDYKNSDRLFGTSFSRSKDYQRSIYVEWLEQTASLAEARGDYKSQIKAIAEAAKLRGLYDKEEELPPDTEPKTFVMAILTEGADKPQIINLDELNQIRPDLFAKVLEYTDKPSVNVERMQLMLNEHEGQ